MVCEVGVAPVKPAEFVIFRLSQFSGGTSLVRGVTEPAATRTHPTRRNPNLTHTPTGAEPWPLPEMDTSVGHSFAAEYDGVMIAAIQEVAGVKMEQDVIELKQNTPDGKYIIKKLPGRQKAGEVALHRAASRPTTASRSGSRTPGSARWARPERTAPS